MSPTLAVTAAAFRRDASGPPSGAPEALGLRRREEPAVEETGLLCLRCLEQAGLGRAPGSHVGLVLAAGSAIHEVNAAHARVVLAGAAVSPHQFIYTTPNAITARVSILLGLDGECLTLPEAAAPFWAAADLLAPAGRATAVLAGGVAPGPGGIAAGVLCLELPEAARRRGVEVLGFLVLEAPGRAEQLPALAEASAAVAAAEVLETGLPAALGCGQRGILRVTPLAQGRTEFP